MEAEKIEQVGEHRKPSLWIIRASLAMGVPLWLGVVLFGLVLYPVLWFVGLKAAGLSGSAISGFFVNAVSANVFAVFVPILGMLYISRTADNAIDYAKSLLPAQQIKDAWKPAKFNSLYSLRFVVPLNILLFVTFFTLYQEFTNFTEASILGNAPCLFYLMFVIATDVWVYAYSMYLMWKLGELPLALKPFTEDRTLGLRPFGAASLKLTAVYVLLAALGLAASNLPFSVEAIALVSFSLLGIGLFFLPLLSLHRKLVTFKAKKMYWVSAEHGAIMEEMEAPGGLRDAALATRHETVKSVREEVSRIRDWPLDTEIMARLATLVLFPIAIAIGAPFFIHFL